MKIPHIIVLTVLLAVLTALQASTLAGEPQSVLGAPVGFDPQTIKAVSDTLLEVFKDWWFTVFVPILVPLAFPGIRDRLGKGMESTGKKLQPKSNK